MKKSLLTLIIGISLITLIITPIMGCGSTKTYYLPDASNGFTELKISDEVYQITVQSRNVKERQRMIDIFYLRAAEIAKENDYPYFYTVDTIDSLTSIEEDVKPYKARILTAVVYQNISVKGVVKLLKTKDESIPHQIHSTQEMIFKKRYLMNEVEKVFGKKSITNQAPDPEGSQVSSTNESQTSSTNEN